MAFPVPVDARAARAFEVVLGHDTMLIQSAKPNDTAAVFVEGEWVGLTTNVIAAAVGPDNWKVLKASGATLAAPLAGARICLTKYTPSDTYNAQADAVATSSIDVASGQYQAKTTLWDVSGDETSGNILVVISSVVAGVDTGRGVLAGVPPSTATARQLACSVGRIIAVLDGVLHFESK